MSDLVEKNHFTHALRRRFAAALERLAFAFYQNRLRARLRATLPAVAAAPPEPPPPTCDELIAQVNRFMSERAAAHPVEALQLAAFISGIAFVIAPALAHLSAAATPPPEPGNVN